MASLGLQLPSQTSATPNQNGGSYTYPAAPAGVSQVFPPLSGGYYNQMSQQMAGPNYVAPRFHFTGLNALGNGGSSPGLPGNNLNPISNPSISGPASGIGTGLGQYAFGGSGGNGIMGGSGSYGNFPAPTSLNIGGGTVTGGYSPSSPFGSLLGGMLGGAVAGPAGALLGHFLGNSMGGGTGGLTLPNGTTLPTKNMNLQPTSIPMPNQNIKLAQPIINPSTGMPYGTAYFSTPQGAQAQQTEQMFNNQALGYQDQAMNQAYLERLHQRN